MKIGVIFAPAVLALAQGAAAQAPIPSATGTTPSASSTGAAAKPAPVIAPQPAASAPSSASSTYRVSAGDILDIYVWGDERLQRSMSVLPDGTFAFPLAGTVVAAGHTPNQIEAELSRLLAGQYKGIAPAVTVSVKQPAGMQVSVIGKVRSPGTFSPTRYVNVLDVLALAGGPTDFADAGNIVILRNSGGHVTIIKAHLNSVLKGKPDESDVAAIPQLQSGDTVVVP